MQHTSSHSSVVVAADSKPACREFDSLWEHHRQKKENKMNIAPTLMIVPPTDGKTKRFETRAGANFCADALMNHEDDLLTNFCVLISGTFRVNGRLHVVLDSGDIIDISEYND